MFTDLGTQISDCSSAGLEFVAYEGGGNWIPPFWIGGTVGTNVVNLALEANEDPRMATMYTNALTQWQNAGGGHFNFYSSVSKPSQYGTFGSLDYSNQPTVTAYKYQGILDIIGQDVQVGTPTLTIGQAREPLPPVDIVEYNMIIRPYPNNVLAPTVMVFPGGTIVLKFDFSQVLVNNSAMAESIISASFLTSSNSVAAVSRSFAGSTAAIVLTNNIVPGQTISIKCIVTGSLGTQAAGFVYLVGTNSF